MCQAKTAFDRYGIITVQMQRGMKVQTVNSDMAIRHKALPRKACKGCDKKNTGGGGAVTSNRQ